MITGTVIGSEETIARLSALGSMFQDTMRKAVSLTALKVLARVKLKLSDDVLHVKTGRLRRSITQEVVEGNNAIIGQVGTNVVYARVHELGFKGTEQVREHLRTIKVAFGKKIKGGPVTFTVRGYSRKVDFPKRSFLASSLEELGPEFLATVEQYTSKALKL